MHVKALRPRSYFDTSPPDKDVYLRLEVLLQTTGLSSDTASATPRKVCAKTKINLLLPQIGSRIIYQTGGKLPL